MRAWKRLSPERVREVRAMYAEGRGINRIMRDFGATRCQVLGALDGMEIRTLTVTTIEDLEARLEKPDGMLGCWLRPEGSSPNLTIKVGDVRETVHRVLWAREWLEPGEMPGRLIRTCASPRCVSPLHWAVSKGRPSGRKKARAADAAAVPE